jgi:hypothetical protein
MWPQKQPNGLVCMSQSPIADPLNRRAVTAPWPVDFEILANEVYRGHEQPVVFYRFARSVLLLS